MQLTLPDARLCAAPTSPCHTPTLPACASTAGMQPTHSPTVSTSPAQHSNTLQRPTRGWLHRAGGEEARLLLRPLAQTAGGTLSGQEPRIRSHHSLSWDKTADSTDGKWMCAFKSLSGWTEDREHPGRGSTQGGVPLRTLTLLTARGHALSQATWRPRSCQ